MSSAPAVAAPVFEHHHNGFGLQHSRPRISWRFLSTDETAPRWKQTGYEVEITKDADASAQTFRVQSSESVLVPWPAEPLQSRSTARVRVRAFGQTGSAKLECEDSCNSEWSSESLLEVALLEDKDWSAQLITSSKHFGEKGPLRPLRFYKRFDLPPRAERSARLYITALGVFNAYVNGQQTCDECFAPGWTSYNHRLGYRVHDVSSLLQDGANTICVEVAEGWYAGQLGIQGGGRFLYGGEELGLIAQLEIKQLGDAESLVIISDSSWSCSPSAVLNSEIYNGEEYDLREERKDWTTALPIDTDHVCPSKVLPWTKSTLFAPDAPPVRVVEKVNPVRVFRSKSGKLVVDFGQNVVGKLLIRDLQLPKGSRLTLKHAEVMEHGELGIRPLRSAKCTDCLVSAGDMIHQWTPKFTYHGFRYAQLDGWPTEQEGDILGRNAVVALVMHSDMKRLGYFESSNNWINKLHENVVWSMRGNFFSVPTDCPQRAERLGWTGDLNLFCPTANFLYDTSGMLGDWLQDMLAEHMEDSRGGIPPLVVPDVLWTSLFPANIAQAIWDDATVLTPWSLFQYSGDVALLERQFISMQTWLEQGLPRAADGLWQDGWQFADWLDPAAPPLDPAYAKTDGVLVADVFLIHTTATMAKVCTHLGKDTLAAKYSQDADRLKLAFHKRYISPAGNLMGSTQTGLALAIHFGIYDDNEEQLRTAGARLEHLVRAAKFHIATGFAGTPVITSALTRLGKPQLAYRMLLEKTCPSWLYPITKGATTIWERWDSMMPDDTINPGVMTSFNHYALGAVADWIHGTIGGISPLEPGWKTFQVKPVPGGNLTWASVTFNSPYGIISCRWSINDQEHFEMQLVVPPNSEAAVTLPSPESQTASRIVGSGTHHFSCKIAKSEWPPAKFIPPFLPRPTEETIAE